MSRQAAPPPTTDQPNEDARVLAVRGVDSDDFLKVERNGLEPIPVAERHGSARELSLVWSGAMANYISLLTGAVVVIAPTFLGISTGQLGILDSAVAIIIGAALAAALHGLLGATGARTGTPQMVFSRAVLGHRGAYPGALFTWIMAIGWFAVDSVIGGWALVQLLGMAGVPRTSGVALGCITFVLAVSVVVAVYGHQTVHVFEKYGAVAFLAFCALLFIVLFPKIDWTLPTTVSGGPRFAAMIVGGSLIYALVASWIPFASDYSRYLPARTPPRKIAWWTGLGIGAPTALLGILGVALFTIDPANPDLLSVITGAAPRWLTVPFLLFVVLGEIWANYFDVYTAGLVALAMDVPLRRWWSALICGGVGAIFVYAIGLATQVATAPTYTDLVNNFLHVYENFLLLTYLWVPAWAAVLLVDFFFVRHGRYAIDELTRGRRGTYWYQGGVRWSAVVSWLLGVALTIPFMGDAQVWQGPLAGLFGGADFSGVIGALVSAVVYYALMRRGSGRSAHAVPGTHGAPERGGGEVSL